MFAPIGFRAFGDIVELVGEAADSKWPTKGSGIAQRADDGRIDWQNDNCTMNFLYRHWLLDRLLGYAGTEAYLASPSGGLVKVRWTLFKSTHWQARFAKIVGGNEPTKTSFNSYSELVEAFELTAHDQFRFLDQEHGTVRMTEIEADLGKDADNSAAEIECIGQFVGWVVCFKEDGFPKNATDLRKLDDENFTAFALLPKQGRPRMREEAADAFRTKFPSGRGQKTWAEVEDALGYKAKTIRNGLASLSGKKVE